MVNACRHTLQCSFTIHMIVLDSLSPDSPSNNQRNIDLHALLYSEHCYFSLSSDLHHIFFCYMLIINFNLPLVFFCFCLCPPLCYGFCFGFGKQKVRESLTMLSHWAVQSRYMRIYLNLWSLLPLLLSWVLELFSSTSFEICIILRMLVFQFYRNISYRWLAELNRHLF